MRIEIVTPDMTPRSPQHKYVYHTWTRSGFGRWADAHSIVRDKESIVRLRGGTLVGLEEAAEAVYAQQVKGMMDRSKFKMAVALQEGLEESFVGWVAWEGDILNYVYVKQAFRHPVGRSLGNGTGVAHRLIAKAAEDSGPFRTLAADVYPVGKNEGTKAGKIRFRNWLAGSRYVCRPGPFVGCDWRRGIKE